MTRGQREWHERLGCPPDTVSIELLTLSAESEEPRQPVAFVHHDPTHNSTSRSPPQQSQDGASLWASLGSKAERVEPKATDRLTLSAWAGRARDNQAFVPSPRRALR